MKGILKCSFDYLSGDISGQERTAHFLHQDKTQLSAFYFLIVSHEFKIAMRAEIGNRNRLPNVKKRVSARCLISVILLVMRLRLAWDMAHGCMEKLSQPVWSLRRARPSG